MKANEIKELRGSFWKTDFKKKDIEQVLANNNPRHSVYYASLFSLTWLVEKIFNNQRGKPLKLEPFQSVMLDMMWTKKFPMIIGSRGLGKTFMLAVYCLLKAILIPGSRIVICGAGFRQAKLVFKYIESLYEASPLVKEALSRWHGPKYGSDQAHLRVGLSTIIAIPIGDGEKIRGIRATVLICDEFASIPEEIFEIVIKPFTAVHADPAERASLERFIDRLRSLKAPESIIEEIYNSQDFGNQVLISGTASYRHNHFYKRYRVYRMFIASKGDPKALRKAMEEMAMQTSGTKSKISQEDVTRMSKMWRSYAVFQMPYNAISKGFLDEDSINSDRASFPEHRFAMEYLGQFPEDSDGFIKRSWVERATPRPPDQAPVVPELYGDPSGVYVMGLDPARNNDNFGCVVLKITNRGRELVYVDAWRKTAHHKSAHKIREICKRFNIAHIAMDKGGGGDTVRDELCRKSDEVPDKDLIWQIPDQLENPALMSAPGKKILELVNFSPSWIAESAHAVAANIEKCRILFPSTGDIDEVYNQYSRHFRKDYVTESEKELLNKDLWGVDEWEADSNKESIKVGLMQHIDECINETCAIAHSVTAGGTERFDLPKLVDQPEGLDMRRRDRWSALMLANYAAKIYDGHGHKPQNFIGRQPGSPPRSRRGLTGQSFRRKGSVMY